MAHHVPADILPEILRFLPVKSLLRFRCVSKAWLALVDHDAEFACLHLNTFNNNNSDETPLLVIENDFNYNQLDCVVRCSDTFKPISKIPIRRLLPDYVSSVDGMVLLKSFTHGTTYTQLWNPSLRQFHDILFLPHSSYISETIHIGLGYDPWAKDYKLVRLIYNREVTALLCSVAIYTIGARSWKIIPIQKDSSDWHSNHSCRTKSVYLQGNLYFIATDPQVNGVWNLVSFDLNKEVFSFIPMYDTRFESLEFTCEKKLSLIDGRFYVLVYDRLSGGESIWVMERETMNWTKYYSFNPYHERPLYVKKKGDLLTYKDTCVGNEQQVALYNPETRPYKELLHLLNEKQVALYNPETRQYKELLQMTAIIYYVSPYVESLFLHQCNARIR